MGAGASVGNTPNQNELAPPIGIVIDGDAGHAQGDSCGSGSSDIPVDGDLPPEADGEWTSGQWIAGLTTTKGLSIYDMMAKAICGSAPPEDHLSILRSLGKEKDSRKIADKVKGALGAIVDMIFQGTKELTSITVATTQEYNDKYVQVAGCFDLSYGSLDSFYGGLENQVGAPRPEFLRAVHQEHCDAIESDKEFTTGNYGITTTSRTEFAFAFGLDGGAAAAKGTSLEDYERMVRDFSKAREAEAEDENINTKKDFVILCDQQLEKLHKRPNVDAAWPSESTSRLKDRTKCRQPRNLVSFIKEFKAVNRLLANIKEPALLVAELLGARLYTGPMFVKYNAVLRAFTKVEFMVKQFKDLCEDNLYVTTLHAINSSFVKLSKIQAAQTVYRGMSGGRLPAEFKKPNQFNVCGGIEFAFMSTTTDRSVSMFYASNDGKPGVLFEIQLGMVDRGADLRWLSQYPHEAEICFGPLSGLQVIRTRVESSVLIVEVRLNVNMLSMTLEQVVAKRYKVVAGMCDNIMLEINKSIKSDEWTALCRELNDTDGKVKVVIQNQAKTQLSKIKERGAEDFNTDKVLLDEMKKALSVGSGVRLQRAAFLDQAADALPDVPALALATRRLATKWRQDELVEQEVTLKFEMRDPPNGELWFHTVLGLQRRADGELEVALVKQYIDSSSASKQPTALSMRGYHEQLKGQILAAIDGDRDLGRKSRELQAAWNPGAELRVVLTLGRDHTSEEALVIFEGVALAARSGEVETVASRLTRLLEVNPGLERLEELNLVRSGLSDEAGAAIAIALARAGTSVRVLELGENPGFSLQAACALGRLLATNDGIQEMLLMCCELGDVAGAELLEALARRSEGSSPLRMLGLEDNGLGTRAAGAMAAALRAGTLPALEILGLDDNAFSQSDEALIRAGWEETKGTRSYDAQLCGL